MPDLSLAHARIIIAAALKTARDNQFSPLAIVVLDAGARPVAFEREDGAGFLRLDIAQAKAAGAIGMGYGTRDLAKRAAGNPGFYTALYAVSQGQMAPSPGGVLIRNASGEVIGAVGVSGDTGDNDERAAVAGLEAAGLTYDTGAAQ
ncbi:MAG: heme-binding protein [Asticcacaulis sp.]|uniref:GlcG/HbpS family heme-binding protein n=1 Tax=Asticcacaulis sp. TaxID=1872648 RepID=UPI0039E333C5